MAFSPPICTNGRCRALLSEGWLEGWKLRNGKQAPLCNSCGLAYKQLQYCDIFHADDAGWRTCQFCKTRLHCGCSAAVGTYLLVDAGGVECRSCGEKDAHPNTVLDRGHAQRVSSELGGHQVDSVAGCPQGLPGSMFDPVAAKQHLASALLSLPPEQRSHLAAAFARAAAQKQPGGNTASCSPHAMVDENGQPARGRCIAGTNAEGKGQHQVVDSKRGRRSSGARGNAEGQGQGQGHHVRRDRRGQNMAKVEIVDKSKMELQLPGSIPLFEKTLTASDAAKAGRLVLPKAAAEAFLPRITNSDGQVLIIKDVLGNIWNFHYRFWPNSRMYVLEVAWGSCMQAMALQAGDTVIFGQTQPEKELCLGFRKVKRDAINGPTSKEVVVENTTSNAQAHQGLAPLSAHQHASSSTEHMNGHVADKSEELAVHMLAAMSAAQRGARKTEEAAPLETEARCERNEVNIVVEEEQREDQWVQCDDCGTWRRLPAHVVVPEAWTCSENHWDTSRASCRVPQELTDEEIDRLQSMPSQVGSPSQDAADPSARLQAEPNGRLSRATSHSQARAASDGDCLRGRRSRSWISIPPPEECTALDGPLAPADRSLLAKRRKIVADIESPRSGSLSVAALGLLDRLLDSNEDERLKGSNLSMVQLVEAASAPLDSYMRERGISSLYIPPRVSQGRIPTVPKTASTSLHEQGSQHQGLHSRSGSESDSGTEEEEKKAFMSDRGAGLARRSSLVNRDSPFSHVSLKPRAQKGRRIHGLGRGKQICAQCHAIINTSAKACKECGAQTAFGKRVMQAAADVAAAWAVKGIAYPSLI